jgi:peptidoglycan/xylan/chitin deacetylase (PgdA/CDA1 family)
VLVAGCGSGDAVPPTVAASGTTAPPDRTAAAPEDSTSPPPTTPVDVDWSGGRDAPGMDVGLPSPSGWYEAALGPTPDERVLYLTFDDGPAAPYTDQILDLLDAAGARATFFMVGRVAAESPDLVRRVAAAGHALGNHSWSHADLLTLSPAAVRRELADTQDALLGDGGPCMRPPYGLIDESVASVATDLGLVPVMWTGQAGDWNRRPVAQLVRRMQEATQPGAVLLLHDGGGPRDRTVAAVARLLPWWSDQGYRLEPLPACTR